MQENVVYVPLHCESTYKKATSSHMSPGVFLHRSSSPPVCLLMSCWRLPYTSIVFDWAQFRLGVWRQGAPRGLRAKSQNWAGGSLRGTHVACDPEHPNAAVHPVLQRLTHQLGFTVSLLHGGFLRRELQHVAELLHALLKVQVTWRACMEPTVFYCGKK